MSEKEQLAIARQFLERWSPGHHGGDKAKNHLVRLIALAMLYGEQQGLEEHARIADEAFAEIAAELLAERRR